MVSSDFNNVPIHIYNVINEYNGGGLLNEFYPLSNINLEYGGGSSKIIQHITSLKLLTTLL